jgi:hypothetical protein
MVWPKRKAGRKPERKRAKMTKSFRCPSDGCQSLAIAVGSFGDGAFETIKLQAGCSPDSGQIKESGIGFPRVSEYEIFPHWYEACSNEK